MPAKILSNHLLKLDVNYPISTMLFNGDTYFKMDNNLDNALLSLNHTIDEKDGDYFLVNLKDADVLPLDTVEFDDYDGKYIKLYYYM